MALLLKHQTEAEFISRLREAYRNSEGERTIQLGKFIVAKTGSGDLSDTALRTAFGMTAGQWTAAKNRMNTRITAQATIHTTIGE